jgi:hypothetical protein
VAITDVARSMSSSLWLNLFNFVGRARISLNHTIFMCLKVMAANLLRAKRQRIQKEMQMIEEGDNISRAEQPDPTKTEHTIRAII